jgi:asparagine synthase (glutamine-hydrolysing)
VRAFVAMSFARGVAVAERDAVVALASRAVTRFADGEVTTRWSADAVCVAVGVDRDDWDDSRDIVGVLVRGAYRSDGSRVTGAGLRARSFATDDVAPPFGMVALGDGLARVATDAQGLRPLYWSQRDRFAVASSSSLVAAAVTGAEFDDAAIGAFALLGWYRDHESPFAGVRRLQPGERVTLTGGRATLAAQEKVSSGGVSTVAEGADVFRSCIAAALTAHPDAAMELTGGIDTRAVLAAIPRDRRRGMVAVTTDTVRGEDTIVSRHVAEYAGLDQVVVDRSLLPPLEPVVAFECAQHAGQRRDFVGNPVLYAAIHRAESRFPQGARLSGQNGEYARGQYYSGLPLALHAAAVRAVTPFANWRLLMNDAVEPSVFAAGACDAARADVRAWLRARLRADQWARATDDLYLASQQRWSGAQYAGPCVDRPLLTPFFQPAFVDWARRARVTDKRGSRLFARVMVALDPGLAALPLDKARGSVTALAASGPQRWVQSARYGYDRASVKARQRARGADRPFSNAAVISDAITTFWRERAGALDRLASVPFLDQRAVEAVATGARTVSPSTVGFLFALDGMLAFRDATTGEVRGR